MTWNWTGKGAGRVMVTVAALLPAVAWGVGALAFEDIPNPPEDPLPPLPPVLKVVPDRPEYPSPTAQQLMDTCKSKDFVECFREWKPPPPPPPPPPPAPPPPEPPPKKKAAEGAAPPPPPQAKAPPKPPAGEGEKPPPPDGPLTGKAPPPNPAADKAMLDALAKAIKESGFADKIKLPDKPEDGSVELKFDEKPATRK